MVKELEKIQRIESKLRAVDQFRYRDWEEIPKKHALETSRSHRFDIEKFYTAYIQQKVYPLERLSSLVDLLFDIKIEMMMIDYELGKSNQDVYLQGYDANSSDLRPELAFRKISLDQTVIIKSRIVFEKIMNFIYLLETGEILRAPKGSSKKAKFFKFIENEGIKWSFMADYRDDIYEYDDLRTPEVHDFSRLRRILLEHSQEAEEELSAKILLLVNIFENAFYDNMIDIIKGLEVTRKFWCHGMNKKPPIL